MSEGRLRIRAVPEDFVVDEIPLYEPSGEGEHTFVHVEKRLRTTEEVVRTLAHAAGVSPRDVGYAGRKDRVAVTRQWLSLPGIDPQRARELAVPGARVLEARAHGHKLRTGQLRANRFEIVVRGVDALVLEDARGRAEAIRRRGIPNRFGGQRFGRAGENVERGRAVLSGSVRVGDRRQARFLVSALQAALFNRMLEERPLDFDAVEPGDLAVVHASGGLFIVEDLEREAARAASGEICATGPIAGRRMREAGGAVREREARIWEAFGFPPAAELRPPRGLRLRGARRAYRALPRDLDIQDLGGERARVRFELSTGSYATVLLEELFGRLCEAPEADVS